MFKKRLFFQVKTAESDPCYEKKCTSNENCCDGSVCIDIDLQGRT